MCHEVAKQGQVSIVDVGTVEFDGTTEFLHDGCVRGLDTQDVEDLRAALRLRPLEVDARLVQLGLRLAKIPLEGFAMQVVAFQNTSAGKRGTKEHAEQERCVLLCLQGERTISANDDESTSEFTNGIDDVSGLEVARFLPVNAIR